ncbi:sugar MFS transporter [Algoriphagus sp. A40]|uniref:sugar MFS transporter n=1 Tax=Algoriphagus sp. A40 TaxID=1945863 RepID=UPI000985EDD7|nr:sugar MFS transporter [Algoriphagus sp. A40]OOG73667.1 glucose/galactose MFS transporter [Algoriphagus sp. A40]
MQSNKIGNLNYNILIIGALFFVFGFVTWLGSVLIPYFKIVCQLSTFDSYLVAFAFYISYTFMAIPSAWVLRITGSKKGMSLGLLIMGIGAILFVPAALTRLYPLFLTGLFIQGAGLTILQSASNPYITKLGPPESAAKRISIMGICNGVAGVLAPLILGAIILSDADSIQQKIDSLSSAAKIAELDLLSSRVIIPYILMMAVLMILSVVIYYSALPEVDTDEEDEATGIANVNKKSIFQFPHLLLGVLTLFLYVGVEVIAVDTVYGYATSQGVAASKASFFASFTILNMLIGYVIGIVCIPRFIKQDTALKLSALAGILFVGLALMTSGMVSVVFISMLGLANSLIWPSIWPLAIDGLGRFTKTGSSLLIMAIGGGAILPLLYGYFAENYSTQGAYFMILPCYLVISFYSSYGHKIRT